MSACSPGLYDFVIPEDLPIGKMGGKVKANDRDIGENAKSTYNVIEGDDQGVFEIITDTQTQEGILRLKKVRPRNGWSHLFKLSVAVNHWLTGEHISNRALVTVPCRSCKVHSLMLACNLATTATLTCI